MGTDRWSQHLNREKNQTDISKSLAENEKRLAETAGWGSQLDVMYRPFSADGVQMGFFYLTGLADGRLLLEVFKRISLLSRSDLMPDALKLLLTKYLVHVQISSADSWQQVMTSAFSGVTVLFIDKQQTAILIDARSYPGRGIEEPQTEKIVRGSKDGFVETLLTNISLVRRRIRDPMLQVELLQCGAHTRTDVAIVYLRGAADPVTVDAVRERLHTADLAGLTVADKQLEEVLVRDPWNPYPLLRYSERPDVVTAHLLEGHVVVLADTTPGVLIVPSSIMQQLQHAEEYRQTPVIGTYLRLVRMAGVLASVWLSPLWLLFVLRPDLLPPGLSFIGPSESGHIPIVVQFILAEIGVDLMRMAAVHTPTPLATSTGLIAAVLIGDVAIKVGLFSPEVILYLAVVAIGSFATPSYELGLANRLSRLLLLVLTALGGVTGLAAGTACWILYLGSKRVYGKPYLWPVFPMDISALWRMIIRKPDRVKPEPSSA